MVEAKNKLDRKGFFDLLFESKSRKITAGLNPYATPLKLEDAYHLIRRACIPVDIPFAKSLVGKTASQAVDSLINNASQKTSPEPPSWWNNTFEDPATSQKAREENLYTHYNQNKELQKWWLVLMNNDTNSILERMTLFWHGHFTSQYTICNTIPAQQMYRQNALFRKNHLGKFPSFLEEITLDGAMLIYLNGNENINLAPNENYARELLELFSTGIGQYTEEDVREAARVLTGWKINFYKNGQPTHQPYLQTGYFDTKEKTVFGEKFTVNYEITEANVRNNSINKFINTIITKKGDAVAKFMADKFYRLFVYSNPNKVDQGIISELATSFKNSGFDVKTLISTLLKSEHFFDNQNRGVMIKSPADLVIGFTHFFKTDLDKQNNLMKELGLELLNPPNVAGWRGYRSWVTTKNLPLSIEFITSFLNDQKEDDIANWAKQLDGFDDSYKITSSICSLLLGKLPSEPRVDKFMNIMLGGAPYYEWPQLIQNNANAGLRVKALLREIIKAPDFYVR